MRSTHYRRGRTTTRRKLVWTDAQGTVNPLGVAPAGNLANLMTGYGAAGGQRAGVTIMRIRATFGCELTPTTAVTFAEGLDVGFIVDDDASLATELHTNKLYLDWMLLKTFFAAQPGAINNTNASPGLVFSFEIDLRAKRKMQELNQTLWLVMGARTGTTLAVNYHVRTLLALP